MNLAGPPFWCPVAANVHICASGPLWAAVASPTSDQWGGLAQSGGTWVAVGRGQAGTTPSNSIYSTNAGVSWAAGGAMANLSTNTPLSLRLGAHNGWLIAVGNFLQSWVSVDKGVTWTTFSTGGNFGTKALESGNNLFVYLDASNALTYSSPTGNGVATNAAPAKLARCWWIASRGLWLGLENGGTRSWTSPDLVTWTAGPTMPFDSAAISPYGISQNGTNIVIVYNSGTSQRGSYSTDNGATFTASAAYPLGAEQSYSVAHGNGIVLCTIAIGSSVMVSADQGATWAVANANTVTKTWILGYSAPNGWLAVGGSGSNDTIVNVGVC